MDTQQQKEIKVNPHTVTGSTYTQLVGVTVTDHDVTLEFVYLNPRNTGEGEVVSRVTMPRYVAVDLANTINFTLKSHVTDQKKKEVS